MCFRGLWKSDRVCYRGGRWTEEEEEESLRFEWCDARIARSFFRSLPISRSIAAVAAALLFKVILRLLHVLFLKVSRNFSGFDREMFQ